MKFEKSVESVEFLRYNAQILHLLMHLLKLGMWDGIKKKAQNAIHLNNI